MTPTEAIEFAIYEALEFGMSDERTEAFRAALRLLLWQPIKTAPKDGEAIFLSDGKYITVGWWAGDAFVSPKPSPTHWMPLMERPK
jgi:hypothetical protein